MGNLSICQTKPSQNDSEIAWIFCERKDASLTLEKKERKKKIIFYGFLFDVLENQIFIEI